MLVGGEVFDAAYVDRIDSPIIVIGLGMATDSWEHPIHSHRKAQLIFADTGLITVETEECVWVVPPQSAVWIPGGMVHRARNSGDPKGFAVFIEPRIAGALPDTCSTMAVSPFLRALLERTAALPSEYDSFGPQARLMGVLLDELAAAPPEWLHLPMPSDPRLRKLADAMLATPSDHTTLDQWAGRVGMSERNMARLFVSETGLSVSKWRRHMHIITALPLLAQGQTIQSVADELGYDSPGAFVTMFRKEVGAPPRRFLAERTANIRAPLNIPSGGFYEYQ
ncbi:helix-turn-helix transcriptional regulator [Agrobacterium vitis]|uniref:AraC family transcriptional regulator n=1 Tax=Rhizobium/Agrobacterium group TaxID=227290 RepID=UPI001F17379A|nr:MULTISPECIES: helix-turn-helix transcriptional regulator [Rhizobium/Agrobacterium group]MCF1501686.1 helix-turn-helix transcriptional regulator [Allorhizobium sp. Av2]MCM2438528.1 helix-turn-helix transcriptional regulator [Agrobacterium vitis]MCM2473135.1 helix-turn-helix transcriptional regulator [Rhizobium sp. CG5]